MGCFLGCFGAEKKDHKRRNRRIKPQIQRNKVENVQQEILTTDEEQIITETTPNNLVSELQLNKPTEEVQTSPSPKKKVTFDSNVTTYAHVPIHDSITSLPEEECNENIGIENQDGSKTTSPSYSPSEDDSYNSVISSVGSYPPNHRYHNARESDDEYEEYYDDDDEDDDLDDFDDEDDFDDNYDENSNDEVSGREMSSESFIASSMESTTKNPSARDIDEEVESLRDRSDYANSVLKPIENITQWKAAKTKSTQPSYSLKSKNDQAKNENREIAIDASLSNWLVSPQKNVSQNSTYERRL